MRRLLPLIGGASLATLVGCCGGGRAVEPTVAPAAAPSTSVPYDVHEWGLVRAEEGDVLRVGAIAPSVSTAPVAVWKPVLYFHAAAPLTLESVTVRASGSGSLAEVWPLAAFDTSVRWEQVALAPGTCEVSALPTEADAPCTALPAGELCETAGLAVARTTDGACVTVGATVDRFLFYRARATRFTPPLLFERTGTSGEVRVTNEGSLPIPGLLVRIRSSPGAVSALAALPPAAGGSILVAASFDAPPATTPSTPSTLIPEYWSGPQPAAAGRSGLRSSMLEIGLTEPEADAFLAAWDDTLFGVVPTFEDFGIQSPVESFVYFLPEPTTDGIATLELVPPPRTVHRAIAVWSRLAASGPSH